jgi:hypothetical protein
MSAWTPGRGDYGADNADDLVLIVQKFNCSKGCARAGSAAAIAEFGPGGDCEILLQIHLGGPIPALEKRAEGPHCTAREPL